MRRITLILLLFISSSHCSAQQPKGIEIFGGISSLYGDNGFAQKHEFFGWHSSLATNITDHFAIVGDFGGVYNVDGSVHSFLAGPRLKQKSGRVTSFAHLLAGGVRGYRKIFYVGPPPAPPTTETTFAFGVGGGIDVDVTHRTAIRIFQVDWLRSEMFSRTQNNVNLSFGITIRFGEK